MGGRANRTWAPVLALSAGLSLAEVLTVAGAGRMAVPMAVLAYLAGRRMASLSLALWIFTSVGFVGLGLAFWRSSDPLADWLTLVTLVFAAAVLPWWVGRYQYLRAEHREHERTIVAEQARLRERARIARDMHDSLGHELALIALRAGALELAKDLTDHQREAATELRASAVRATDRLHDIVRVLGTATAATELQPADESIDDLVRRAAAAGMSVRLRHHGPTPAWTAMTGQAAHRVVQESLTNAARHAPGAPVTVTVTRQDAGTRIDVVNDAAPRAGDGDGGGQGLIGLHERVRLTGGSFAAGPRPDGGWAVTALLPDNEDARPADDPVGFELRGTRRLTRRRQLQSAALPLTVALLLVAALAAVQLATVRRTGLAHEHYAQLQVGRARAAVEPVLPPHSISTLPRLLAEPPPPTGSTCVYYQAGDGLLDLDAALYRLCFADGVLVSKDRLERA